MWLIVFAPHLPCLEVVFHVFHQAWRTNDACKILDLRSGVAAHLMMAFQIWLSGDIGCEPFPWQKAGLAIESVTLKEM